MIDTRDRERVRWLWQLEMSAKARDQQFPVEINAPLDFHRVLSYELSSSYYLRYTYICTYSLHCWTHIYETHINVDVKWE